MFARFHALAAAVRKALTPPPRRGPPRRIAPGENSDFGFLLQAIRTTPKTRRREEDESGDAPR